MTQTRDPRALDGTPPRRGALALLDEVLGKGRMLSDISNTRAFAELSGPDQARARRLAVETLRSLERADTLLRPHLRKTPPLAVQNVLRLGTYEICTGAAAYGVVNAMVEIVARQRANRAMKGLVNAVLRKIARDGPTEWAALPIPRLPKWLRAPLREAWGAEAVGAMEAAHFAGAPLDLTAKADPSALAAATGGVLLSTGSVRLENPGQVSEIPGFSEGAWWVQDAAAALPVRVLSPAAGQTVLDLCAAPGGKTLQLAALGAEVTALDISEARMRRVEENLTRTGLSARLCVQDALMHAGAYDAILLDAPCSATGTLRRHPDLPHAKDAQALAALVPLQRRLLDHAWSLLRPGGRLVYCTCALMPEEGEAQVAQACARHPDMRVNRHALELPGVDPRWLTQEGGLRLRPDYWAEIGGMDGFYMAALDKTAD